METRSVMVRERRFTRTAGGTQISEWLDSGVATLHGFGVDYEELQGGPGTYSVAIIEWPNGQLEMVAINRIRFLVPTVVAEGGLPVDAWSPKLEPTAPSAPVGH